MASTSSDTSQIAHLNDLIQLDHDAVQGYTVAIDRIHDTRHRDSLVEFRADHKRHIEELAALVRARGGLPVEVPHPTGALKLAVQALGAIGNDVALLLAFKAVEGQVRDKYRRAARREAPADVAEVVSRAAADEDRHYAWVERTLREMGAGTGTLSHGFASAVEQVHKLLADPIEGVEREVMRRVGEAVGTTRTRGGAAAPMPGEAMPGEAMPGEAMPVPDAATAANSATPITPDMTTTASEVGDVSGMTATEAANALGAQRFVEALRALEERYDLERMVALFDETAEIRNPTDDTPRVGQSGAREFWRAYRDSFEEIRSDFSNVVETDGTAVLEWTSRGRILGGRPIDYSGVSVIELQDGKVRRFRSYFDTKAFTESARAD
jgi:ketosteroid isomerase-like protein/rubrerythrin